MPDPQMNRMIRSSTKVRMLAEQALKDAQGLLVAAKAWDEDELRSEEVEPLAVKLQEAAREVQLEKRYGQGLYDNMR